MKKFKDFKMNEKSLSPEKYRQNLAYLIYGENGRNPGIKDHYNPALNNRSSFGKSDVKDFEKLADSGFKRLQGPPVDTCLENTDTFSGKKEQGRTF